MSTSNWMDRHSKLIHALKEEEDSTDITKFVKTLRLIEKDWSTHGIMKTAIYVNRLDFVDSIIKIDPSIISYKDEAQTTYLLEAINRSYVTSNFAIIHLMIKRGFDVNARTNNGITPLIAATLSKNSSIVTLLVENGADIDRQGFDGNTALIIATYCFEQVPNLIKLGAFVNIRNNYGFSAFENILARKEISAMKLIAFCT